MRNKVKSLPRLNDIIRGTVFFVVNIVYHILLQRDLESFPRNEES